MRRVVSTGLAASLALNFILLVVALGDISHRGDWTNATTAFAAVALPGLFLGMFGAMWWAANEWSA